MQEKNLNISSLIVMCKPEDISRLWEEIEKIPNAQCHYSDKNGKIVVTLETESIDEKICLLRQIEKLQGVVLAQMIYAYHNAELEILQENIQRQDAVPEVLKNNKVKAEEIGYNGDVQGKLDNILKNVL